MSNDLERDVAAAGAGWIDQPTITQLNLKLADQAAEIQRLRAEVAALKAERTGQPIPPQDTTAPPWDDAYTVIADMGGEEVCESFRTANWAIARFRYYRDSAACFSLRTLRLFKSNGDGNRTQIDHWVKSA